MLCVMRRHKKQHLQESSTHATSSLTSVSALRHDLALRIGRLLRPHLDSGTKLSSPPIATVKEEEDYEAVLIMAMFSYVFLGGELSRVLAEFS